MSAIETPEEELSETALLAKLHRVAEAISHVEKRGHNKHHNYSFVQATDVVRDVRELLLRERLIVLPAAGNARHEAAIGGKGMVTTVDLGYTVRDTDTGAAVTIPWVGVGADIGGDKGIYKAYTGGFKYALLAMFMIPTTDDPEGDGFTERPSGQDKAHKDDERPVAPRIPVDRARAILDSAVGVGLATVVEGQAPELHAVFQAVLAQQGVEKIGALNVDQAEAVEAFLKQEAQDA